MVRWSFVSNASYGDTGLPFDDWRKEAPSLRYSNVMHLTSMGLKVSARVLGCYGSSPLAHLLSWACYAVRFYVGNRQHLPWCISHMVQLKHWQVLTAVLASVSKIQQATWRLVCRPLQALKKLNQRKPLISYHRELLGYFTPSRYHIFSCFTLWPMPASFSIQDPCFLD